MNIPTNKKHYNSDDEKSIKKIDYSQNKIFCQCSNFKIKAKLLLACDGKNSAVRSMAQTPLYKKNYNENALVVNFEHTINHNNCAYEFFYRNGPLAILPMQKQTNFQSSLISVSYTHLTLPTNREV